MGIAGFFTTRQWNFISNNFIPLLDKMSVEDQQTFYFDVRQIDWQSYLSDYCFGIRRHILKEKDDTIPAARISLMKFYLLQKMASGFFPLLAALTVFQLLF